MNRLTLENYKKGFLIDDEWMAGVTEHPEDPGTYVAFVLRHTTGEYLGYQPFQDIQVALNLINELPRQWTFEKMGGGCGNGNCGEGACAGGACASKKEGCCS